MQSINGGNQFQSSFVFEHAPSLLNRQLVSFKWPYASVLKPNLTSLLLNEFANTLKPAIRRNRPTKNLRNLHRKAGLIKEK